VAFQVAVEVRGDDAPRFVLRDDDPQHTVGKLRNGREPVLERCVQSVGLDFGGVKHDALDPRRLQLALGQPVQGVFRVEQSHRGLGL
jgi:hypothetical protein